MINKFNIPIYNDSIQSGGYINCIDSFNYYYNNNK